MVSTLIKTLIAKTYPNYKFKYNNRNEVIINADLPGKSSLITIMPFNNWREIKRNIDKKIAGFSGDCVICCEKIKTNVSCPKCSNGYCGECYLQLYKRGRGVVSCPHCRYSHGEIASDAELLFGEVEIKVKLGYTDSEIYGTT